MDNNKTLVSSIFYALTEEELFNPGLIDAGLTDIKRHGFDSIYLEYRNTRTAVTTPRWQKAVRHACRAAARAGLGVFPATPVNLFHHDIIQEHPEAFTDSITPYRTNLKRGSFSIDIPTNSDPLHFHIEAAWLIDETGPSTAASARDVSGKVQICERSYEGGGCLMTEVRGPGHLGIKGLVRGERSGRLLLVLRRGRDYSYLDMGHPVLRRYVDRAMDLFKGLPLRGMAWDEPHFGYAFWPDGGRAINDRLYAAFHKRFGRDLGKNLVDLWYDVDDRKSALTRLQYGELLEAELEGLERYFMKRCQRRFAPSLPFVGIHRTMHEELADDAIIGCADYFRHNRQTSAGFTDSVFERDESMVTMFGLARSMALLTPSRCAFSNNWGFKPTAKHHAFYLPLMGAMNIRWIGHAYRSSYMFGPGYPDHPLWRTLPIHVNEHRAFIEFQDGAAPWADTAVLYNWAAPLACPDAYMHVHRRNLLILGRTLTELNVQYLFVDPATLNTATLRGSTVDSPLGQFRRLIVTWANLMDDRTFETLEKMAKAGVEILIFGAPAERTADGRDLRRRFAALVGLDASRRPRLKKVTSGHALSLGTARYILSPKRLVPRYHSNPHQTYPDHFRTWMLSTNPQTSVFLKDGRSAVGIQKSSVRYVAAELPHYMGLLARLLRGAGITAPKGAMVFAYTRGEENILTGVGRWGEAIKGRVAWRPIDETLPTCRTFRMSSSPKSSVLQYIGGRP